MSILDDLAQEATRQYHRVATLLGGNGTTTSDAAAPKAALLQPTPSGPPAPTVGDKLRSAPMPDTTELQQRLSPPKVDTEALARRSGALDAAYANASNAPRYAAPPMGVNPNVPPTGSPEANAFRASQAAEAGPRPTIAGEAVAPRNVPLLDRIPQGVRNAGQTFADATTDAFKAQMPSLPSGDGLLARGARYVGNGVLGAGKLVARAAEPVIEGARVAQVAMDPTMTKADVAQQAVEGAGRWGATAAGASLGAGVGALTGPAAPVASPVLALAGGVGGYMVGDEGIKKLRSMLGLGDMSPAERSSARLAAPAPAGQPGQPADVKNPYGDTVTTNPNGSQVATSADGSSSVLVKRPTDTAPAAAATPTVAGEAKAATAPKRAAQAAPASPVAAAATAAPGVDAQIAALEQQRNALGISGTMRMGAGPDGVSTGWVGEFTDKAGNAFSTAKGGKITPEQKALADQYMALSNQLSELYATQPLPSHGLIEGGQQYQVDNRTGIKVPLAVAESGKTSDYLANTVKAKVRGADPLQGKIEEYNATQGASNREVANIRAGADVTGHSIAAEASRYGYDKGLEGQKYKADKDAENVKRSVILQDETVDDGTGGVKVVKRAYTADGTPITQPSLFKEGQVFVDPKTGQRAIYRNGKWEPAK